MYFKVFGDVRLGEHTRSGAGPRCCEMESPGKIILEVDVEAPPLVAEGGISSPACMHIINTMVYTYTLAHLNEHTTLA